MSARPFYITTTLPYVNADPHLGFALELIQADIIARYRALLGDDVFFTTGTDEHGQKIFEAAKKAGQEPQAYVDAYAAKFRSLKRVLGLSSDIHFIRTTEPHHVQAAQEMWKRCVAAGDIYPKEYSGLYCVGCEAFKTAKEVENGRCALHPSLQLAAVSETNYFFRLSKYQDALLEYLSKPGRIVPEWRQEEAIAFVNEGLEDFSISRERHDEAPQNGAPVNQWGIPVPGDDSQVMYVWFDALTNYISTLGWPFGAAAGKPDLFEKYWKNGFTLQLAGKDQVRFQSIMWQAMLTSAGLKTTDQVFYHGFITSGGQKMSKSLGNVIDPIALAGEYGTEALRFFLARHVHPVDDSDVTPERLKEAYNADLANGLGNLVARVMNLSEQHLDTGGPTATGDTRSDALERYDFQGALAEIWRRIQELDQEINTTEPYKVIKTDRERGKQLISHQRIELMLIARSLAPFMPETSAAIEDAVRDNKKPENLFPREE